MKQKLTVVTLPEAKREHKPQLHFAIIDSALGTSEFTPFETLNQVSAAYRGFCESNGLGASEAGCCQIFNGAEVVAHVSYNGRVWQGEVWQPNAKPIFDPAVDNV